MGAAGMGKGFLVAVGLVCLVGIALAKVPATGSKEATLIQVPSYITTEADLDSWFKNHGTKVVEVKQGVPEKEGDVPKKAEETTLIQVPSYITTEADLDSWFKNHGTKVVE